MQIRIAQADSDREPIKATVGDRDYAAVMSVTAAVSEQYGGGTWVAFEKAEGLSTWEPVYILHSELVEEDLPEWVGEVSVS